MTKKDIEDLIKFISKSGVAEVKLEFDDVKLTIVNNPKVKNVQTVQQALPAPQPVPAPPVTPAQAPEAAATEAAKPADESSKYIEIKSPMIGTFYRASSPEKPNFVNVGDEIKVGTPICIIEAMKLFNEIESEVSGKVVKVLVENASPVQYGQTLMLVEPS